MGRGKAAGVQTSSSRLPHGDAHTHSTPGVSTTRRPEPAARRAPSTRAALMRAPAHTAARAAPVQRATHTPPTQRRSRGAVGATRSVHTATLWAALRNEEPLHSQRPRGARAHARAPRPLPRRLRLRQDTATWAPAPALPRLLARRRLGSPPRCPPEVPRRAHALCLNRTARARGASKEGDTHTTL